MKPAKQPLDSLETEELNGLIKVASIGNPTSILKLSSGQIDSAKKLAKKGYVRLYAKGKKLMVLMAA